MIRMTHPINILMFKQFVDRTLRRLYRLTINNKVNRLHKKHVIKVLFVLNDISKWKSESLYQKMVLNERFEPILGVTFRRGESVSAMSRKALDVIAYLESRNYDYIELTEVLKPFPDIVIYTEPYGGAVPKEQSLFKYWNSLFINIPYSCNTTHLPINYHARVQECAWIDCYESKTALEDAYRYIGNKRKNMKLTGLPMLDILLSPSDSDPWKKQDVEKKRIIWAPHHSLGGFKEESIIYGNFLDTCDYMFDMAVKYAKKVQFAFKPHPLLREKLNVVWGTEKTNDYFEKWVNLENGQLSEGMYTDLFKNSDAMIHDSSSFMVEYQVINKPLLFIVRNEEDILRDFNRFGERAFYSQKLAHRKEDIEEFILEVINGIDIKQKEREKLISEEVLPFNNNEAADNIIAEIINA